MPWEVIVGLIIVLWAVFILLVARMFHVFSKMDDDRYAQFVEDKLQKLITDSKKEAQ